MAAQPVIFGTEKDAGDVIRALEDTPLGVSEIEDLLTIVNGGDMYSAWWVLAYLGRLAQFPPPVPAA